MAMAETTADKLQRIKDEYKSGNKLTFIGFFGNRGDTKDESTFSNFHQAFFTDEVVVDLATGETKPVRFATTEQYFMYLKARQFNDNQTMKKLLKPGHAPHEYKQLGREVKGYNDKEWDSVRYEGMKKALRLKYSQNAYLHTILMKTGDSVLVEASPFDRVWGVGLGKSNGYGKINTDWRNPLKWKGTNLLGLALMDIREEFKQGKLTLQDK